MKSVFSIGECMAELGPPDGHGRREMRFGGDTLNTAVYLARMLGPDRVSYVTRLGDDPQSAAMVAAWGDEGLRLDHVARVPGRTVGLYAIDVDAEGERSFTYWRGEAPVRQLLSDPEPDLEAAIIGAGLVYFSGITLAVLSEAGRERLLATARAARDAGALVAYDPNYRARLWESREAAAVWTKRAYKSAAILLSSPEEEEAIFGDTAVAARGPDEIILKNGANPTVVLGVGEALELAPLDVVKPVDTTGAGDSFNAGYLSARLSGAEPEAAVRSGQKLAARVVAHRGAVIAKADMP